MTSSDFAALCFLLVDDNPRTRAVVRTILEWLGMTRIREAVDGTDGIHQFQLFPADIIICDRVMAPMDGLEFVRRVRTGEKSPNRYVPIIMLTAHTEQIGRASCRERVCQCV